MPETKEATISRIIFQKPDNPWKSLKMSNGETWVGEIPDVTPGMLVKAEGHYFTHKKYGLQFQIDRVESAVLPGVDGIEAWLTYRLPQIGKQRAKALVKRFGEDLWDVIDEDPGKLTVVKGITKDRAKEIAECYREHREEQRLVAMLVDLGLGMGHALKAFKTFGLSLDAAVEEDPYCLMDVEGVSFDDADRVAMEMGLDKRDPRRVRAYARSVLEAELNEGHCYAPLGEMVALIARWNIPTPVVEEALEESPRLVLRHNDDAILLDRIEHAENVVAGTIRELTTRKPGEAQVPILPDWLDPEQKEAVIGLLNAPVAVLTGGPGTGKTTTLKTALSAIEAQGERIRCAAPTGKAARRMEEVTERHSSTVHRLLEWTPAGWKRDATNPFEANVIIIDESSMVDVELFASVCEALGGARLIIVGDPNQLPSIGPGQVLFDLIRSGALPVFELKTIHRQAGESWVVDNARLIIEGHDPALADTADFTFHALEESDAIVEAAMQLYRDDPEVQILTPEHRNGAGTILLNNELQSVLNPNSNDRWASYLEAGGYKIYAGDKVLYTKNNYDIHLVNGDVGRVLDVYTRGDDIIALVDFSGKENPDHPEGRWELTGPEARPLTLAYAMTVHKSQGSEWPNVGIITDKAHWSLRRQLLYTAVTRTYKRLSILGSAEAVSRAVKRPPDTLRRTLLQEKLNT